MTIGDVVLSETVQKLDRTKRLVIDCDLTRGGDFLLTAEREVVLVKDGAKVSMGGTQGEREYTLSRKLSEIAEKEITLPPQYGGVTLTGAQIAAAVEALVDSVAQES